MEEAYNEKEATKRRELLENIKELQEKEENLQKEVDEKTKMYQKELDITLKDMKMRFDLIVDTLTQNIQELNSEKATLEVKLDKIKRKIRTAKGMRDKDRRERILKFFKKLHFRG